MIFMIDVNYKGKVKGELRGQQGGVSKGNLSPKFSLKLGTVGQIHSSCIWKRFDPNFIVRIFFSFPSC